MTPIDILSALTKNRTDFFALLEQLERQTVCTVDAQQIAAMIDAHYSGRSKLSSDEAYLLLLAVSHRQPRGIGFMEPRKKD